MITHELIRDSVENLYRRAIVELPPGVVDRIVGAGEIESSETAKKVLGIMANSARLAIARNKPICADTNNPSFLVRIGGKAEVAETLEQAMQEGMASAVKSIPLTGSSFPTMPEAITGVELSPLSIAYDYLPGRDYIEIVATSKAGGAEPYSTVKMIRPPTLERVKEFVVSTVKEAGPRACPPYLVAVGIGGVFEAATRLSYEAATRRIDMRHPQPAVRKFEEELLEAINKLGYGPMGLGGRTSALAVNVEVGASSRLFMSVAVSLACWLSRWAKVRLYNDGEVQYVE